MTKQSGKSKLCLIETHDPNIAACKKIMEQASQRGFKQVAFVGIYPDGSYMTHIHPQGNSLAVLGALTNLLYDVNAFVDSNSQPANSPER